MRADEKNSRFIYRQPKWSAFSSTSSSSAATSFDSYSLSFLKEAFSIKPSFSFVQQNIIYFYYISVRCGAVCA